SPVWPLLKTRAWNTLILTVTAMVCSWLIAIPAGILAAARVDRWQDRISAVSTTFLLATPDVLVGIALLAFALRTRWLPSGGMHTLAATEMGMLAYMKDLLLHLVLPVMALTLGALPLLVRHVRSAM